MRNTAVLLLLFIWTLICLPLVKGQDIHLSHIHASPPILNPSLTGLFEEDIRLIGNVRQQWKTVPVNYQTMAASIDASLLDMGRTGFLSGGFHAMTDKAGDLDFRVTQANFSVAFAQPIDYFGDHYFSVGLQTSLANHSLDYSKIVAFDPEPLSTTALNSMTYLDFSTGISWFFSPRNDFMMYLGTSLYHLARPNVSMLRQAPDQEDRLYRRLVIHGGIESKPRDNWQLLPSFIFMDQGPHQEINIGSFFRYDVRRSIRAKDKPSFYMGAWFRWYLELDGVMGVDAVIASLRLDYRKVAYTFSYDFNVSSLSRVSNFRGGPELSIIYKYERPNRIKHKKRIRCPKF